jgi:hypothetical protein
VAVVDGDERFVHPGIMLRAAADAVVGIEGVRPRRPGQSTRSPPFFWARAGPAEQGERGQEMARHLMIIDLSCARAPSARRPLRGQGSAREAR